VRYIATKKAFGTSYILGREATRVSDTRLGDRISAGAFTVQIC
jgi:hypothetical protein